MFMTRFLLALEVVVMFFAQRFVVSTHWDQGIIIVLNAFFVTLMMTGIVLFLFSLVQVDKTPTGALCFNPRNPYWRFMKWIYPSVWGSKMSLCKTHWLTELIVMGVTLVSTLSYIALQAGAWAVLKLGGIIALMLFMLGVAVCCSVWFGTGLETVCRFVGKTQWYQRHERALKTCIAVGAALTVVGGVTAFIAYDLAVDLFTALLIFLNAVVMAMWLLAAVVVFICALVYCIATLEDTKLFTNTAFGQFARSAKERLCPTLYECNADTTKQ